MRGIDGKPVALVLDAGSVRHSRLPKIFQKRINPELTQYYEATQAAHLESLGLNKGAIKGVFNDAQLEAALQKFIAERGEDSSTALYPSALRAGVSPSEFGDAARKAAQAPPYYGYCMRIRKELTQNKVKLGAAK